MLIFRKDNCNFAVEKSFFHTYFNKATAKNVGKTAQSAKSLLLL